MVLIFFFFSYGHCILCTHLVWFESLLFRLLLLKHSMSPDTQGEVSDVGHTVNVPSPAFFPVPYRGLLGSGGHICRRELGTRSLQSIWQSQIQIFLLCGMDKQGAGTTPCSELHSSRWKVGRINGATCLMAPSASAVFQKLSGQGIILSLFKSCIPRYGVFSPSPLILPV